MTFGGEVKNELCRLEVHKKCCAQAEAYGVLLYCNTFSGDEVRIVTEHEAFAQRLPVLFKKAFRLTFDRLPQGEGKYIFSIQDPASWRPSIRPTVRTGRPWPCTSTSPCWRRTAAGPPSCGGPFWPGAG